MIFSRDQNSGQMVIDEVETKTGEAQGTSRTMNVAVPYFMGGLSTDIAQAALRNLDVSPRPCRLLT